MNEPPFYTVEVCDVAGNVVTVIDNPISVTAARGFNTRGAASIELPRYFGRELFQWNSRFKIYRTARNYRSNLFGDTVWFLKKFRNLVSQDRYVLELEDALSVLDNYLVAYTAQTPYADKTLEEFDLVSYTDYFRIDNLMKQYVRENGGELSLDTRRINPHIIVENNNSKAGYGEKQASWATLSSVLQDLAGASAAAGIPIYYDLLPRDDGTFLFRTWTGVRGVDRGRESSEPLVLDEANNELDEVEISDDYSNIGTLAYVLGYDNGPSQVYINMESERVRENPFSRVEFTHNAPDVDVIPVLVTEGLQALHGRSPRRIIAARISAAASLDYDIQFSYGFQVVAQADGEAFDCQITAVNATWREGVEALDIRLDGSRALWKDSARVNNTAPTAVVPTPINSAPIVSAGPDQIVIYPDTVNLDGSASDDGLPDPPATMTTLWTKTSGPGTATFGDASAVDTTVDFDAEGVYVLRLTADDSQLSSYDEVTIDTAVASAPFDEGLVGGIQRVAVIGGKITPTHSTYIWRTDDFQTLSGSGGPTWNRFQLTAINGFPYSFVVDPFSEGYIDGVGPINGWIATGNEIVYVEDIFAATPTVTTQVAFAADHQMTNAVSGMGWRTIGASFGRYFEADEENPWLICAWNNESGSGSATPLAYQGLWTMYSMDAGVTWSAPYRVNAFKEAWADRTLTESLALYMSPKTPGLAFLGGFSATGSSTVPSTGAAFVSTDWGATWSSLTDPALNPEQSMMNDMHVPWMLNDDEDLVYHGALEKIEVGTDRIIYKLKRITGATVEDISPVEATVSYGPAKYSFSIRAYDSDRNFMVMAGKGNGVDDQVSNKYAVFVSEDGGDTWTLVLGPIGDSNGNDTTVAHPHQAAFAGDNPDIIFAWGALGYMRYSTDFGATWDNKQLSSASPNITTFGICGGVPDA